MNRFVKTILLSLILFVGGWLLYHRHQIHSPSDAIALAQNQLGTEKIRQFNPFEFVRTSEFVQNRKYRPEHYFQPKRKNLNAQSNISSLIRVASFKVASSSNAKNITLTADICQQYDVVAIQNNSKLSIAKLVNELNQRGFDYRFVDQRGNNQKFATIFNRQTIVLEDQHWYSVNDPEDLFLFEPLVAWFRVANAPVEHAFTFSLANVQLNDSQPDRELNYLGELFRAIRLDGRGEDDILIAGDFHSNDRQLKNLQSTTGLDAAIVGLATNTRNDMQLDNLLFDPKATVEYSGESGVFDFMKRFNLTLIDALAISNRMPVWAEFSILEGQTPGRAADQVNSVEFIR